MNQRRFVLLRHEHQGIHFDLMFEDGCALRTWKLHQPLEPGRPLLAEKSFDHRIAYLDYEGPISGNRGVVTRWDGGWYEGDFGDALLHQLTLDGAKLRGRLTLKRINDNQWELAYSHRSQNLKSKLPR